MLFPFLGYIVASTALTAVAVLLTDLVNTATLEKGRHRPPPVIARTVKVEVQRHSPAAKEASPAKDVSSFVATAKADTKKSKHYKPKVFAYKPKVLARQRNNYRYGNAQGYAQGYGYGPRGLFFSDPAHG
jgi:hypothetical protein